METLTQHIKALQERFVIDYEFVPLDPPRINPADPHVAAFVAAMNARDFVQHPIEPGRPPDLSGWSYGLPARHFDGRVTTRRTTWVYAKKVVEDPSACAEVYLTVGDELVGYLRRAE